MMSLRARLFVVISLVVLIILGISIFLVVRFGKKTVTPTPDQSLPISQNNTPVVSGNTNVPVANIPVVGLPVVVSSEDIEKNTAKQLAKVFIERYGTYSTDNGVENVKEVKNLVVASLWTTLSKNLSTVEVNENQAPVGAYSGMNTQVFSTELSNWTTDSATITMQLVRTEEKNGVQTVKHQNAEINMVKQNGQWLVQNFKWL